MPVTNSASGRTVGTIGLLVAGGPGGEQSWQQAAHRSDPPIEGEFADEHDPRYLVGRDLPVCCEHGARHRKVPRGRHMQPWSGGAEDVGAAARAAALAGGRAAGGRGAADRLPRAGLCARGSHPDARVDGIAATALLAEDEGLARVRVLILTTSRATTTWWRRCVPGRAASWWRTRNRRRCRDPHGGGRARALLSRRHAVTHLPRAAPPRSGTRRPDAAGRAGGADVDRARAEQNANWPSNW